MLWAYICRPKPGVFWEQMLEAVQEVHQRNIIHADLKPANFLLVGGELKVGLKRYYQEGKLEYSNLIG